MKYELKAKIVHKSWNAPLLKTIEFEGETLEHILNQMKNIDNVPEQHLHNLMYCGKTAFKDANGVKHSWRLKKVVVE